MVLAYTANPDLAPMPNPTNEQWESELASSDLCKPLCFAQRANTAGRTNEVLD